MWILRVFGLLIVWQNLTEVSAESMRDWFSTTCKAAQTTTPLRQLKQYLFCDYDPNTPMSAKVFTITNITLMPKLMEFAEGGVFTLHNWLQISWNDDHFTWEPVKYGSIEYFHVKTYDIWTPNFCLYNSGNLGEDQCELPTTDCTVYYTGKVLCVPDVKYDIKCTPDYTYWPYDKHECPVIFGSWVHTSKKMDYKLVHSGINLNNYENNSRWDMRFLNVSKKANKHSCCPNDTFLRIEYKFELTRHHGNAQAVHITPVIALVLLTLTIFWLDSRSTERVAVASVNFICHLLCIHDLHWALPYNGINTPHILLFYRESLGLATFALFLTVFLRKLQSATMQMPSWMSSSMSIVLSNKVGRFLVLKDEECAATDEAIATEENSDASQCKVRAKESSWRHFAAIIEWLSFICVVFAYFIILITLVPMG